MGRFLWMRSSSIGTHLIPRLRRLQQQPSRNAQGNPLKNAPKPDPHTAPVWECARIRGSGFATCMAIQQRKVPSRYSSQRITPHQDTNSNPTRLTPHQGLGFRVLGYGVFGVHLADQGDIVGMTGIQWLVWVIRYAQSLLDIRNWASTTKWAYSGKEAPQTFRILNLKQYVP